MSKPVKEMIARELAARYAEQTDVVWVELLGTDGITTNEFRRDLRARQMCLEVVRNALLKRACAAGPMARLAEALHGPAALVTGGESAVDVAKVLDEWKPKLRGLKLRGALLDGEYLDAERVQGLSVMPGKRDLQARIAGIALCPGGKLVAAILSGGGNIAGCLKVMIGKLENGEEIAKKSA